MSRRDLNPKGDYRAAPLGALLILSVLLVAGCEQKQPDSVSTNVQTETPATAAEPDTPAIPALPPALTRGDLVSAAGQAASTYAEGKTPPASDPLVGRSFAVRIPFGCTGAISPEASKDERAGLAGWSWGSDRKTIQLSMTPGNWSGSAMLAEGGAAQQWEAVEGFWIPRPWLASETCPAVQGDPLQTGVSPASPQTVGLAAVFEKGGSRIGRRNGRAYEFTIRPEGDKPLAPPTEGYRMLLEGRITSFPNGRAIDCRAAGPDQRPVCIIAMQLDRVGFEDASGRTLTEWRPG